jgi:hypothetical protein
MIIFIETPLRYIGINLTLSRSGPSAYSDRRMIPFHCQDTHILFTVQMECNEEQDDNPQTSGSFVFI